MTPEPTAARLQAQRVLFQQLMVQVMEGEDVTITRQGEPVAVIVSAERYEKLRQAVEE